MAFQRSPSQPEIILDDTPTGDEEFQAWLSPEILQKKWDPDAARTRIDRISRRLATFWSFFLVYIIIAQGNGDGYTFPWKFLGLSWRPLMSFHLPPSEFIAVVTTTTVTVFGFLVIVANHLFKTK